MSTGPQSSSTTTCLLGTPVTSPLHSFQLHESFHNIRIAPVNKELCGSVFEVKPSPNNEKMSQYFVYCSNIPTFVEDKRDIKSKSGDIIAAQAQDRCDQVLVGMSVTPAAAVSPSAVISSALGPVSGIWSRVNTDTNTLN